MDWSINTHSPSLFHPPFCVPSLNGIIIPSLPRDFNASSPVVDRLLKCGWLVLATRQRAATRGPGKGWRVEGGGEEEEMCGQLVTSQTSGPCRKNSIPRPPGRLNALGRRNRVEGKDKLVMSPVGTNSGSRGFLPLFIRLIAFLNFDYGVNFQFSTFSK